MDISSIYENKVNTRHIVYTPKKIVRKIISISFSEYFDKKEKKRALRNLKIIDISCGTGNFLVEILENLIKISKIYYGEYKFFSNWVTGIDIDKDALEICQNRCTQILRKYNIKNKKINLIENNSLTFEYKTKYDIIVGNPPYIGERKNKDIFREIRQTDFGKKYYEGKMDYFYFFIEKGIDILKKNGILSYITTNYWLRADFATKLRGKIKNECEMFYIENFEKSKFTRAQGQHNMIFAMKKTKKEKEVKIIDKEIFSINSKKIYDNTNKILLAPEKKLKIFNIINKKSNYKLKDLVNINQGIVSGCDKAFVTDRYLEEFQNHLKPFYKNSDISGYSIKEKNKYWILYINNKDNITDKILDYLYPYKDDLSKRREVKNGVRKWYELQWPREKNIFESEKIIGRQRGNKDLFAYSNEVFYGSADIYYLTKKKDIQDISLYYILAYLNSSIFYDYFYYNGKRKGKILELYANPLKETPIYYPKDKDKINYIEDLIKIQMKNKINENKEKIDNFFAKEMKI